MCAKIRGNDLERFAIERRENAQRFHFSFPVEPVAGLRLDGGGAVPDEVVDHPPGMHLQPASGN